MRSRRYLGNFSQQLYVGRAVIEVIIADQAADGLSAELAVLFLIHTLEDGALVPAHALVPFKRAAQFRLGHAHHADLQKFVGFCVGDEVMQAAPRPLQLLEIGVMHHAIDLLRHLSIDLGDDGLDGAIGVRGQADAAVLQRLVRQRAHGMFHCLLRLLGLGLEFLLQQGGQVIRLQGLDSARVGAFGHCGHGILRKSIRADIRRPDPGRRMPAFPLAASARPPARSSAPDS